MYCPPNDLCGWCRRVTRLWIQASQALSLSLRISMAMHFLASSGTRGHASMRVARLASIGVPTAPRVALPEREDVLFSVFKAIVRLLFSSPE